MLRRLIDVLCIAVVAAVIAFAVMGRGEYVSAFGRNDDPLFRYLNFSWRSADAEDACGSSSRRPLEKESCGSGFDFSEVPIIYGDEYPSDSVDGGRYGSPDWPIRVDGNLVPERDELSDNSEETVEADDCYISEDDNA